ncbi:MAG: polysaccharide biosynthesis/export family protein [Bacteroidota bacterium]
MHKIISRVLLFGIIVAMVSCNNSKKLYLFNDQVPSIQKFDSLKQFALQRIHPSDRLSITISSTDPALTSFLNPFNLQMSTGSAGQPIGYLVNSEGSIEFPLLGKVKVSDLSTVEASKLIKEKLAYYYKDLFVNVNLYGKVYFVNGRQGTTIQMYNERLTIFEAISQSGVQDPFDLRNQLWLVREDSGQRYFAKLDLSSKKIFESPYYYLQSNDLIYLKPGKFSGIFSPTSPVRGMITIIGSLAALLIAIKTLK